ncbi:MAG TPA: hypothetical protein VKB41_05600 [Steroidobacteraceae bacterium]|nr:hypothetical protein [Steroidobacteraceae bacterium]
MKARAGLGRASRVAAVLACLWAGAPLATLAQAPEFPFGVYDKATVEPASAEGREYYAKLFALLRSNHINTVLAQPYKSATTTLDLLEQARRAGIHVIMSVGNPLNPAWDYAGPGHPFDRAYRHPSVIAYKYGDEPKDLATLQRLVSVYGAIDHFYSLPIVTAVAGENSDFSSSDVAVELWNTLHSKVRFARFYPLRRVDDLASFNAAKMRMPFDAWASRMESFSDVPWWYIAQTFGKGMEKNAASYWRFPTSAELSALTHIALANGARAIIGYALQDHSGYQGLVDEQLNPRRARDGSIPLEQYRHLGALTAANAALLSRHQRASFDVVASNEALLAVPRYDPQSGTRYLYLVNKNTESALATTVILQGVANLRGVLDQYTGAAQNGVTVTGGALQFRVSLAPGDAQFWALQVAG